MKNCSGLMGALLSLFSGLLLSSCFSASYIITTTSSSLSPSAPILPVAVEKVAINEVENGSLSVSLNFTGDENRNSIAKLYYCSVSLVATCDPMTGVAIDFERSNGVLNLNMNFANLGIVDGTVVKYQIVVTDDDGGSGDIQRGYFQVTYNSSLSSYSRQLNSALLGRRLSSDFGTNLSYEYVRSMVKDSSGNYYLSGVTNGSLSEINGGGNNTWDFFIAKMKPNGSLDYTFGNNGILQIGKLTAFSTTGYEDGGVLSLSSDGNYLFLGGTTDGSLGGPVSTAQNIVVLKIRTNDGSLDKTFGDGDGQNDDGILQLNTTFLSVPTSNTALSDLVISDNSIFLLAYSTAALGGPKGGVGFSWDVVVIKLNESDGALVTAFGQGDGVNNDGRVQINASNSFSSTGSENPTTKMIVKNNKIYFAGSTSGSFGGPRSANWGEGFIVKMNADTGLMDSAFGNGDGNDSDGIVQINASNSQSPAANVANYPQDVYLDSAGNLFVTVDTTGPLGGVLSGSSNVTLIKMSSATGTFDPSFGSGDGGNSDGILQINSNVLGGAGGEAGKRIFSDDGTNIFLAGMTTGSLGGTLDGANNLFLLKISSSTGQIQNGFGSGDGQNNDGVLQFNSLITPGGTAGISFLATDYDLQTEDLILAGAVTGDFGGPTTATADIFFSKISLKTNQFRNDFGAADGSGMDGIYKMNQSDFGHSRGNDGVNDVYFDGNDSVYLVGLTTSSLGGLLGGSGDCFVAKMKVSTGALDRSFGNGDGINNDGIVQLNNFVTPFSTDSESCTGIVADSSGNLYLSGQTAGSFGGTAGGMTDVFVVKIKAATGLLDLSFGNGDGRNSDGILQINAVNSNSATQNDLLTAFITDGAGALYLGGYTASNLGGTMNGVTDAFVVKVFASSGLLDTAFGQGDGRNNDGILMFNNTNCNSTSQDEVVGGLALDGLGGLFVTGATWSAMGGANAGNSDVFVAKVYASSGLLDPLYGSGDAHNSDGILQMNTSYTPGGTGIEWPKDLVFDGAGSLYLYGISSAGTFGGASPGGYDVWIAKISATNGVADVNFGNGDGQDNDGIVKVNNSNSNSAAGFESAGRILLDPAGNVILSGGTTGALSGVNGGPGGFYDGFLIKLNSTTGVFDNAFGDGDGRDNDGILHYNAMTTLSATSTAYLGRIVLVAPGKVFGVGSTSSVGFGNNMFGVTDGGSDFIYFKMDTN